MKLNQRDKMLLIGVFVVLVWIAGIMLFIKPAIESARSASQELDSKEMELSQLQTQIKEDENLPQETQDAFDKAKNTADVFYDVMPQYEAAQTVQKMLDGGENKSSDSQIKNLNLSISELGTTSLNRFTYAPNSQSTTIDAIVDGNSGDETTTTGTAESTIDVNSYNMSFDFECNKSNLMNFLNNLETYSQKSLVINELSIADVGDNQDGSTFTGSISLTFMMVRDIPGPDEINKTETQQVNATAE